MDDTYIYITVYDEPRKTRIESTYDANFVDLLKEQIPSKGRGWIPRDKCWVVDKEYVPIVVKLAIDRFDRAFKIEGNVTIDLHSGEVITQGTLFKTDEY